MSPIDPANLAALTLVLALAGTALIDARSGRVPRWPLYIGGALAATLLARDEGWRALALRLIEAGGVFLVIWLVNALWRRWRGHDAIGMGDARWSALAAFGFGWVTVAVGWALGAWVALGWLGLARLLRYGGRSHVHFAPFLALGLAAALWWLS